MQAANEKCQMSGAQACAAALISGACLVAQPALAAGTAAGREIFDAAQATFQVGGVPQAPVASNGVRTFVDELLDVVVVSDDGGAVAVSSPQAGAVAQFTVTNTGNGSESFRLIADASLAGDVFDPAVLALYLEANGFPGLQIGAGGDTAYLAGSNDPLLPADATQVVYVESAIPAGQAAGADGLVELRAVANTIIGSAGTDDPNAAAFPAVGDAYPGQGDLDDNGSSNVTAVVGTSHDPANRLFLTQGSYQVSAAVVTLTKSAVAVVDPSGGASVVPGARVTYQISVAVTGIGTAANLVIADPIPAELEYLPGSLAVSALPPGEEEDDDFAPLGTDNTGFDAASRTITVNLDGVSGGSPVINITFQTTIR